MPFSLTLLGPDKSYILENVKELRQRGLNTRQVHIIIGHCIHEPRLIISINLEAALGRYLSTAMTMRFRPRTTCGMLGSGIEAMFPQCDSDDIITCL